MEYVHIMQSGYASLIFDMRRVPIPAPVPPPSVKSGSTPVRGPVKSGWKQMKGQGQGAGQGVSPAGVGDRLDSTTKDNKR